MKYRDVSVEQNPMLADERREKHLTFDPGSNNTEETLRMSPT